MKAGNVQDIRRLALTHGAEATIAGQSFNAGGHTLPERAQPAPSPAPTPAPAPPAPPALTTADVERLVAHRVTSALSAAESRWKQDLTEIPDSVDSVATTAAAEIAADVAVIETADAISASATLAMAAVASVLESPDSTASAGALPMSASAAITEQPDEAQADSTLAVAATGDATEAQDSAAAQVGVLLAAIAQSIEAGDALATQINLEPLAEAGPSPDDDIWDLREQLHAERRAERIKQQNEVLLQAIVGGVSV